MASRAEREKRDKEIVRMRIDGHTQEEIALSFGLSEAAISGILRKNGFFGEVRHGFHKNPSALLPDSSIEKKIEEYITVPFALCSIERIGDEYAATIRYNECGHTKRIPSRTLRGSIRIGRVIYRCQECEKIEKQREKMEARKNKRQIGFDIESEQTQLELVSLIHCCVCNALFEGRKGAMYCKKCRIDIQRVAQGNKEKKRRAIYMKGDKITLDELFKRSNGICYICGNSCDYQDFEYRNGIKECGNSYPSIDHVIPISAGGQHTWSNVRLACRICNSKKRDIPLEDMQLVI